MIRNARHQHLFSKVIRTPSFLARRNYFTAIAILIFAGLSSISVAQNTERTESGIAAERASVEVTKWELILEGPEQTRAVTEKDASLRWSWADNGRLYGNVHIYTAQGRPVALVEFFSWFSPIEGDYFQCTSMTGTRMTATRTGESVWTPRGTSVVMRDVPDGPVPATTAAARLVQMRRIAEEFRVEVEDKRGTGDISTTRQLRLLPRPMFRYESAQHDALDGAIFAYVISTDPGAMLLIEATRTNGIAKWRYGFVRVWTYGAQAYLGAEQVWSIPEVDPRKDMKADFYLNVLPQGSEN